MEIALRNGIKKTEITEKTECVKKQKANKKKKCSIYK